jgi:hypothetical protein
MSGTPPVLHTDGMGTDSTALMLQWIFEPETWPCDLRDLLVVTRSTGGVQVAAPASLVIYGSCSLSRR